MRTIKILVLTTFLLAAASSAQAITCNMISVFLDDARSTLERTSNETDFEAAKNSARKAKNALDEAAMASMNCKCTMAFSEFDSAASKANRAKNASTPQELYDSLNRAINSYNSALKALESCR